MINVSEFKPMYRTCNEKEFETENKIVFIESVSRTISRYDFDREITYKNRKGEEFTRI